MPELLFVAYHVPPRGGVAASRSRHIIRRLPSFGWNVTVVTPRLPPGEYDQSRTVETKEIDFKALLKRGAGLRGKSTHGALGVSMSKFNERKRASQRIIEFAALVTEYANGKLGWWPFGRAVVRKLTADGRFDAVLSTSPPESAHFISSSVARRLPWLADFRDLWGDDFYPRSHARLFGRGELVIEEATLARAAGITTISEPYREAYARRYPKKPVWSIPNAYDADEWSDVPFGREDRMTIVYAGQLLAGMRDPSLLFAAIADLLERGVIFQDDIRVDIYEYAQDWLQHMIDRYSLGEVVKIRGRVPRAEVMRAQRRADLLLLLLWDHPLEAGVFTGKVFEYMGARRPIVAAGGPVLSVVDGVFEQTGCGSRHRDRASLQARLLEAVERHRNGAAPILDEERAAPYESWTLGRRFAEALDHIVGLCRRKSAERSAPSSAPADGQAVIEDSPVAP